MSLYYSPTTISRARLESVAREMAREIDTTIIVPGEGGFLWVGRDQSRFGPAYDPRTGVRVICSGHLACSSHDWAHAERLPYEGGLGTRLLLERYLDGGKEAVVPFNGSTIIIVHDPRSGEHHVYTDQFGYHPAFIYRSDDSTKSIITTFADALLVDSEIKLSWDEVSTAEFFHGWRATPPNTYFREVKYAGAATITTLVPLTGATHRTIYWRPFEENFFLSINDGAEALASAVKIAIDERTAIAKRPLFFISGGADSRVMLFGTRERSKVTGVNIFEHVQHETDIARRLCNIAGSKFVALQRDNDYYPRQLQELVRWSGGMWSAEDSHYPGIEDQFADLNPDLVMTACTTDWLFKGYGLEKEHVNLLGRSLPFFRYQNRRVHGFLPNMLGPIPPSFVDEISCRMAAWFEGCPEKLSSPIDRLLVEDRRIRPSCYTVSVSGQVMYRIFPYDTFFADSRIADCYSRIHPNWKLNREVWGKAAAIICAGAGDIVDANYGWRVDAGMTEKAVKFTSGWFGRRIRRINNAASLPNDRPPPAGSWPHLGWYAKHSPTLIALWQSASTAERERMNRIAGEEHWTHPLERWVDDGHQLFRLLTILCHWREADRRRECAGLSAITD